MHKTKKLDSSWAIHHNIFLNFFYLYNAKLSPSWVSFCDKAICKVAEHDSRSLKDDEQNAMIAYPENNLNQYIYI